MQKKQFEVFKFRKNLSARNWLATRSPSQRNTRTPRQGRSMLYSRRIGVIVTNVVTVNSIFACSNKAVVFGLVFFLCCVDI